MLSFVVAATALSAPAPRTSQVLGRRALFVPAAAALTLPLHPRAAQAEAQLSTYTDARYGVSFSLPEGWTAVPNQLADGRRLVLASDPKDESTNVFIAFTPIRPDYSSLGSFGTIDYVASTVIPQCGANGECRFANGDAIEGRMLSQATIKVRVCAAPGGDDEHHPRASLRCCAIRTSCPTLIWLICCLPRRATMFTTTALSKRVVPSAG